MTLQWFANIFFAFIVKLVRSRNFFCGVATDKFSEQFRCFIFVAFVNVEKQKLKKTTSDSQQVVQLIFRLVFLFSKKLRESWANFPFGIFESSPTPVWPPPQGWWEGEKSFPCWFVVLERASASYIIFDLLLMTAPCVRSEDEEESINQGDEVQREVSCSRCPPTRFTDVYEQLEIRIY